METVLGWCVAKGGVAKEMMPLSAIELLFKMQEQGRYPGITLKSRRKVKDTGISDMMQRMYQLDFIEPRTKFKDLMTNRLDDISCKDKKFLKTIKDQVVKVGNHYETPLLLRNPEMILPNYRVMAKE